MTSWEVSKYLISAKKDIDSIMFIEENIKDIPLAIRRDYVERIKDHFYINCCVVVDEFLTQKNIIRDKKLKTEWKEEHPIIKQIYYERDKNSAHIDETYKMKNYESFSKLIIEMKSQIRSVVKACAEILPNKLTINYFPHDKVLFRLINKVNNDEEQKILLDYNAYKELTIENEHKRGDLTVYKVDADNNKIGIGGVEFALYSYEFDKITGYYKTDVNR